MHVVADRCAQGGYVMRLHAKHVRSAVLHFFARRASCRGSEGTADRELIDQIDVHDESCARASRAALVCKRRAGFEADPHVKVGAASGVAAAVRGKAHAELRASGGRRAAIAVAGTVHPTLPQGIRSVVVGLAYAPTCTLCASDAVIIVVSVERADVSLRGATNNDRACDPIARSDTLLEFTAALLSKQFARA